MKIGTRLVCGFGAVLVVVIVLVCSSIYFLSGLREQSDIIKNESVPHALLAQEMALNISQVQQFLTDVGATREPDAFKEAETAAGAFKSGVSQFRKMYDRENDASSVAKLDAIEKEFDRFYATGREMADAYVKEGTEAGNRIMRDFDGSSKALTDSIMQFKDQQTAEVATISAKMDEAAGRSIWMSLLLGCGALVIGAVVSIVTVRSIIRPLAAGVKVANRVAAGDLTADIEVHSKDETGQLMAAIREMVQSLRQMISETSTISHSIASASNQLHATAEQIATGSEELASQAGNVAAASEEMSSTSSDVARNCTLVAESSRKTSNAATSGAAIVQETIDGMVKIAERVKMTASTVSTLGSRSEQIGAIIGTIEDIADQTNLLALNAAIEAARAGEQGRGFAVVADEVRALAERTTKATREIGEMIKAIQNETKIAVHSMEEGVAEVENGAATSHRSGDALAEILDQINDVTMQINQIATAAEEQTATTGEIASNIQQISEVVQQTARGAEETSSAAAQLAGQAQQLQNLVGRFKVA